MPARIKYVIAIVAALGAAVAARPQARQAATAGLVRHAPPGFGLMTVAEDQNVRVLVVNTAFPQPDLPPTPCRAFVAFADAAGHHIGDSDTADLLPGESLTVEAFTSSRSGMSRLRPRVAVDADLERRVPGPALPPNPCVATVEVFDAATGRTSFFVDGTGKVAQINAVTIVDER